MKLNTLQKQKYDARGYSSIRSSLRDAEHCTDKAKIAEAAKLAEELAMREALAFLLWAEREENTHAKFDRERIERTQAERSSVLDTWRKADTRTLDGLKTIFSAEPPSVARLEAHHDGIIVPGVSSLTERKLGLMPSGGFALCIHESRVKAFLRRWPLNDTIAYSDQGWSCFIYSSATDVRPVTLPDFLIASSLPIDMSRQPFQHQLAPMSAKMKWITKPESWLLPDAVKVPTLQGAFRQVLDVTNGSTNAAWEAVLNG